ncbi:TD and POZ domain-containing protein 1 [Balamuthia mandrillaris]
MEGLTLSQVLAKLVDNEEWADVRFLVGPEEVPMYAYRGHLALRSPVFNAMFVGHFKEASNTFASSPLKLPEMRPTTFRILLHYVYTDKLPETEESDEQSINREELVHLYAAADHFMIFSVKPCILSMLPALLTTRNVLSLLEVSIAVAPDLVALLLQFMAPNAVELLGGTDEIVEAQWLALSAKAVAEVLKADLEGIAEVEIFKAVHRWWLQRPESEQKEALTEGVLDGVKTQLMSGAELEEVVEPTGLLSEKQLKEAFKIAATHVRIVVPENPFHKGAKVLNTNHHSHNKLQWYIQLGMLGDNMDIYFFGHSMSDRIWWHPIAVLLQQTVGSNRNALQQNPPIAVWLGIRSKLLSEGKEIHYSCAYSWPLLPINES